MKFLISKAIYQLHSFFHHPDSICWLDSLIGCAFCHDAYDMVIAGFIYLCTQCGWRRLLQCYGEKAWKGFHLRAGVKKNTVSQGADWKELSQIHTQAWLHEPKCINSVLWKLQRFRYLAEWNFGNFMLLFFRFSHPLNFNIFFSDLKQNAALNVWLHSNP